MYKYQCSKENCGHTWTIQKGFLNGFTLTCPKCGKGRGLYIAQIKNEPALSSNRYRTEMTGKIQC